MPDHSYVVRFGWTPRDLLLLPGCAVVVLLGVVMVRDGQLGGVLVGLFGGIYLVLWVWALVIRRIALAVTAEGITLGQVPPWPASHSAFVPWSDIEAVVLWRQKTARSSLRYIGLVRRAGAPPLPGSAKSSTLRRLNKAVVPGDLSSDLVADSRPLSFLWSLDKERLTTAVGHFGPDVPVEDRT